MGSFLSVPIRYRETVFGTLYLIESTEDGFSFQDEQVVTALATSAGVAIANARLHKESEQRLRWIEASAEVTQQLFAQQAGRPLDLVLSFAAQVSEADTACLVVLDPDGRMRVHSAIGQAAEPMTGQFVDADNSIAGRVIETGKPVLVHDYASEVRNSFTKVERLGAAIGVPLLAGESVIGAVTVARLAERSPFVESDMDQLAGFANHAGVALELDRGRADRETLRLLLDHDRIAADLHDHVIQELFATGMGMQSMAQRVDGDGPRDQLLGYASALDATIRRIRKTIFQLQQPAPTPTVQA
jgi:GAF domain-containing protein